MRGTNGGRRIGTYQDSLSLKLYSVLTGLITAMAVFSGVCAVEAANPFVVGFDSSLE